MMEFFLSKVWLFVCGIAVLVMAFTGMDRSVADDEAQHRVTQLADVLDSVSDSPNGVRIAISIGDYLPDAQSTIKVSNGYLSIASGADRCFAPLHSTVVMTAIDGSVTDELTLVHGDIIHVQKDTAMKDRILVQLAKERTISLTA